MRRCARCAVGGTGAPPCWVRAGDAPPEHAARYQHFVDYIRRAPTAVAWLRSLSSAPSISAISVLELYAAARSQKEEKEIELNCAPLRITEEIARSAGSFLRHFGKTHGIDVPDAIVAATADRLGLRVATLNVKHFPMFAKLKRSY
jgi:predicted nucleic acid-binding protein